MRIAVIGAGISGLTTAWMLHRDHDITVFEAGSYAGGHTRTETIETAAGSHAVDTGFVVYNEATYPSFIRLLDQLGVASRPTTMSFSVSCRSTGLEYAGTSLNSLFAQRRRLFSRSFLRMLGDITRFNGDARQALADGVGEQSLGQFIAGKGYGEMFRTHYLAPMGSAIWSCSPDSLMEFPAAFFLRFFANHALLQTRGQHPWRVIRGGSQRYVEVLTRPFRQHIRLSCPVSSVRRTADAVHITSAQGQERFDQVILATHADQSLAMLADASEREQEILSAFPYQANRTVLHTDTSLLPANRRARASWNALVPASPREHPLVTYDMSRLQSLSGPETFCISLNRGDAVHPDRVLRHIQSSHPFFQRDSIQAQARHGEISGQRNTHYCGAYWGYGFHEDGVRSALAVTRYFGKALAA